MGAMASQITNLTLVYSAVCPGADQRKHQSSASLAFVRGIHRWPVNSPHKGPVTRKIIPFDDVIMKSGCIRVAQSFSRGTEILSWGAKEMGAPGRVLKFGHFHVDVWVWENNYIPHKTMDIINYPCHQPNISYSFIYFCQIHGNIYAYSAEILFTFILNDTKNHS